MTTPPPPPVLVTATDVCTAMAITPPAEQTAERKQLDWLCVQAAAEIRHRVVAVDARIAAGTLDAERVRGVAVDMVIAALENLDLGFRSTGETYPELATSNVAAANRLTVEMTDQQRASLMPPAVAGAGVYNVPLG
ncbi:head-to-tail adaptor [Gordonia phage Meyran]|nr:head-to-tail adaptor [Gordonia phage Meyran]